MEHQKNNPFYTPILYAVILIAGMYLGFRISAQYHNEQPAFFASAQKSQLDYLVKLLQNKYVDTLSQNLLYENGVEGIISSLDPHTVYIPPQEAVRADEELEGSFYGIGIEFFLFEDTIHISSIVENSPAERAGVKPGDLIIKIDDSLVAGKKLNEDEIIQMIKGTKNSKLALSLLKPNGKMKVMEMERESIAFNSISAAFKVNEDIGYIQIRLFTENTASEFNEALEGLLKQDIQKLIIDVRDNPGGYMDAVTSILDELIGGNDTLLSTRSKSYREAVISRPGGLFAKGAIAVLIDENAASASEILAGAIQDLDRGTIIGRRSYGKGLVQEQFRLPNNGILRITTARYYLPSGRCIQKDYSRGKNSYRNDLIHRYQNGELTAKDTLSKSEKEKFFTKERRIVYGSEGIEPDIFVALDTLYNGMLDTVFGFNIIEQYAHRYFYGNSEQFKLYENVAQFFSDFKINEALHKSYLEFVHHKVRSLPFELSIGIQQKIDRILTAEFAKLLFGKNAKYQSLAREDKAILEAIRYLSK